ncbi:peptidase S8 [Bacillus sp. FJAT-27225]|uniref:S8 family peptidase n=1 Tax=Bacillus sp. FJAT-27225 TaxID=1743144 RepID=UPI00080C21B1|nr:S8 family peptidase [Bacillus sp. FJAT-27225]OCA84214.1 peptidase S8 [Bacillus sp. FJAT-27225]
MVNKYIVASGIIAVGLFAAGAYFLDDGEPEQNEMSRIQETTDGLRLLRERDGHQLRITEFDNVWNGGQTRILLEKDPEIALIYHNEKDASHYVHDEVVVDFLSEPSQQKLGQIKEDINGILLKKLNSTYIFKSRTMETRELLTYFAKRNDIEFAEPKYFLMQNDIPIPNDVFYREQYQWNLPVIGAEKGWSISRGSEDVTIALIDTGVDLDHPDLKNRLVRGYNVLSDNNDPDDDNGHGTHVAGIIASETNNGEGVAGITWYNKIMPIKAMGKEGYGTTFDIAKGIYWAVDHGAQVINMSLGNYQPSRVLKEAIDYAYRKDVVLVAAAGNDNSRQPTYPASYPQVLAVSAVDHEGVRAEFSNYGTYVDIAAPGVYIPSTYFLNRYAALSGTSMAAPHVAGLAGLIRSENPKLSNREVIRVMQRSAIDLGTKGKDAQFGSGMIDMNKALTLARETEQAPRRESPVRSLLDWLSK